MDTILRRGGSAPRRFRNPVLAGCHPDPSICRVGRDFYLVTSSFEYFPGIPIFHSRDLVHWRPIGHVLTRRSQLDLRGVESSRGVYAPTLRYARGRFYVVTTHVGRGGNFYVSAKTPKGRWSDPVWIDADGIDPSFMFDGDDVYYTRNAKGRDVDHPIIAQALFDPKTQRLRGKLRPIWRGMGGIWPEAPHLYKVGSTYYLFTAEGGTSYGHSVMVARSPRPFGPFEPSPHNPILTHRDRPRDPVQATGHMDLVMLEDGTWWAVFLGIRPTRSRHHHLGRETFLAPVRWTHDGWPVVGDRGRVALEMEAPLLSASPPRPRTKDKDDFDAASLDPAWSFLRNPYRRDWSLTQRPGFLRLRGSAVTLDDVDSPAWVGRPQEQFAMRYRTMLDFSPRRTGDEAGLTLRVNERFRYDLAVQFGLHGREALVRRRVRGESRIVGRTALDAGPITLEIQTARDHDVFRAGVRGRAATLAKLPSAALSAENASAGGPMCFTGVYVGMYATGNGRRASVPADFDWFEQTDER